MTSLIARAPAKSRSQRFTSSGSFVVPANVSMVWCTYVGAGGSGGGGHATGGGGGGGGAGGMWEDQRLAVTPGATLTITIGAKGAAVAAATNGNNGNATSITGGLHSFAYCLGRHIGGGWRRR